MEVSGLEEGQGAKMRVRWEWEWEWGSEGWREGGREYQLFDRWIMGLIYGFYTD